MSLTTDTLRKLTTSTVLDVTKMLKLFPAFSSLEDGKSDRLLEWLDFESTLAGAASYYADA